MIKIVGQKQLYTVKEVAEQLMFNPETIYRNIKKGKLKALKAGAKEWRISQQALDDFLNGSNS